MSKTVEDLVVITLTVILYTALLLIKTAVVYSILDILAISTSFLALLLVVTTVEMVGSLVESIFVKLVNTFIR